MDYFIGHLKAAFTVKLPNGFVVLFMQFHLKSTKFVIRAGPFLASFSVFLSFQQLRVNTCSVCMDSNHGPLVLGRDSSAN